MAIDILGSIVSWKDGCSMCGRYNLLGACHSQRRTVHLRCFFDLKAMWASYESKLYVHHKHPSGKHVDICRLAKNQII